MSPGGGVASRDWGKRVAIGEARAIRHSSPPMAVTDFATKVAVVVRDDLAVWQRMNVTAFLMSGITAGAEEPVVGPPYEDADGVRYLPMLRQPVLVFEAAA